MYEYITYWFMFRLCILCGLKVMYIRHLARSGPCINACLHTACVKCVVGLAVKLIVSGPQWLGDMSVWVTCREVLHLQQPTPAVSNEPVSLLEVDLGCNCRVRKKCIFSAK